MLKSTTALLLVYTMLTLSSATPSQAQQVPAAPAPPALKKETARTDLRDEFARQTELVRADSAVFDPVKTERERGNQQAQKKGWSKTKKTLVIAAIVTGAAALTFLLIKYYRKCLRYSDNCTYDPNSGQEDCPCEEYEPRN